MSSINLLPITKKRKISTGKELIISLPGIIAVIAAIGFGISLKMVQSGYTNQIESHKIQIENTKTEIAKRKESALKAIAMTDRTEILEKINSNRLLWSVILNEFSKTVPSNVKVDSFSATGNPPSFQIAAKTTSRQDIEVFKKRVEDSPYFANVFYNSSSEEGEGASKRVSFTFTFNWVNPENKEEKK